MDPRAVYDESADRYDLPHAARDASTARPPGPAWADNALPHLLTAQNVHTALAETLRVLPPADCCCSPPARTRHCSAPGPRRAGAGP